MKLSTPYNKAVMAGVGFLASLLPLFGVDILGDPTAQTMVTSAISMGLVYLVPNAKK